MYRNTIISDKTRKLIDTKVQLEAVKDTICKMAEDSNIAGLEETVEEAFDIIYNVYEQSFLEITQQNIFESKGNRI